MTACTCCGCQQGPDSHSCRGEGFGLGVAERLCHLGQHFEWQETALQRGSAERSPGGTHQSWLLPRQPSLRQPEALGQLPGPGPASLLYGFYISVHGHGNAVQRALAEPQRHTTADVFVAPESMELGSLLCLQLL